MGWSYDRVTNIFHNKGCARMTRIIYFKKTPYYYYDSYSTWEKANEMGRYYKRKLKSKYFILTTEKGGVFAPRKTYKLFLTKIYRI